MRVDPKKSDLIMGEVFLEAGSLGFHLLYWTDDEEICSILGKIFETPAIAIAWVDDNMECVTTDNITLLVDMDQEDEYISPREDFCRGT